MIMINDLPMIMLKCLICTILIEFVGSIIIGVRNKKDLINIILVNIMTNPLVTSIPVYFNIRYGIFERNIALGILEILTLVVEGFIYKKYLEFKKINPYMLSLILNSLSFFIGELINLL